MLDPSSDAALAHFTGRVCRQRFSRTPAWEARIMSYFPEPISGTADISMSSMSAESSTTIRDSPAMCATAADCWLNVTVGCSGAALAAFTGEALEEFPVSEGGRRLCATHHLEQAK
jgi:hypothetical protein